MKKEEIDKYNELEEKICEEAEKILKWYKENVDPLKGEDPEFEGIENNLIWYGNGSLRACVTLPIELLYREEAKQEYLDKLEKEAQLKRHQAIIDEKNRQLEREKTKYERYLELKKEFEA